MINKKYKILKLKSGESLICAMDKVNIKTIIIERPMVFKTITIAPNTSNPGGEVLMIKNWLQFSTDTSVEIPVDHIAAILKPDSNICACYDIEKKKEDALVDQPDEITPDLESYSNIPQKLNINFNVPNDMIIDVLNALGVDIKENFEPTKEKHQKKKSKTPNKNKKDTNWGNRVEDWPADPNDYI